MPSKKRPFEEIWRAAQFSQRHNVCHTMHPTARSHFYLQIWDIAELLHVHTNPIIKNNYTPQCVQAIVAVRRCVIETLPQEPAQNLIPHCQWNIEKFWAGTHPGVCTIPPPTLVTGRSFFVSGQGWKTPGRECVDDSDH
jgi:hypothetical protein